VRWLATLGIIFLLACNQGASADAAQTAQVPPVEVGESAALPVHDTAFNANNAWRHLLRQVELGFRVPGTPGHKICRSYLQQELLKHCDTVEEQEFIAKLPRGNTKMYNIIGRFNLESERRILLCAHWDTRPTADYNPRGQRDRPIPGANDGASGVAVLLELARVMGENQPPIGVDIVLFDGEDYGPGLDHMFFGSKHFARELSNKQVKSYNYGILLDMVGDRDLNIHPEHHSEGIASEVFATAYAVSRELGYRCFKGSGTLQIEDDHLFLIERGIPVYDFIDFHYPELPGEGTSYWHTTEDTPDKCSPDSLEAVGRTVEIMVYEFPDIYGPGS
jgi:GNAT superfamily N-acetyltransferase